MALCLLLKKIVQNSPKTMKLYVSNKNESPRMFENDFVDACSRWHWTSPLWVYVPFVAFLMYLSLVNFEVSIIVTAALFVAGMFAWTFAEYVFHRFLFHYHPKSAWGKRLIWILHGVHHDYPSDAWRLVMPLPISLPLAVVFYTLFYLVIGESHTPAFMAGFVTGYLIYDIGHYAVHHFPIKGGIWGYLREHHMRHHFKSPHQGYGVSSPLWDYVFGTMFKARSSENDKSSAPHSSRRTADHRAE